jgi:hypothetical protein
MCEKDEESFSLIIDADGGGSGTLSQIMEINVCFS